MSSSESPKRLHYGWVMVLAFGLLIAGLTLFFLQAGSGPRYEDPSFIMMLVAFSTMVCGFFLLLWLGIIWRVFESGRQARRRVWAAVIPPLLLVVFATAGLVKDPPSPQRMFHALLKVPMPPDAREIGVTPLFFAGGPKEFAFRCSKQSTLDLIKSLDLEAIEETPSFFSHVAKDWEAAGWKDSLLFLKTDKKGVGYILITDTAMERVVMQRDLLFAKTEEELDGKVP